ncbi:MAG: hypothetical protein HQL56_02275, partial [Magnetococcales bacterium]|nr:hypothetical protein [Magnetococcales bacterium]
EAALLRLLRRVPHGEGDHTDLCRHAQGGLTPVPDASCRCHVAGIRRALADTSTEAARLLEVVQAAAALARWCESAALPPLEKSHLQRLRDALNHLR